MICTQTTWGDITDNYNRTLNHLWTFIVSDQQLLIIILLLHLVCVLSTSTLLKQIIREIQVVTHFLTEPLTRTVCVDFSPL